VQSSEQYAESAGGAPERRMTGIEELSERESSAIHNDESARQSSANTPHEKSERVRKLAADNAGLKHTEKRRSALIPGEVPAALAALMTPDGLGI
jgi:hypothetical protein